MNSGTFYENYSSGSWRHIWNIILILDGERERERDKNIILHSLTFLFIR